MRPLVSLSQKFLKLENILNLYGDSIIMKVLIVEDNSIDTLLFATVVRERGHEVMACISAESALESCQKMFYSLIIADIGLPGMDGLEFCRRVRALPRGKHCFILIITGSPDSENIKKIP